MKIIEWSLSAKIVVIPLRLIDQIVTLKLMTVIMYVDATIHNTITQSSLETMSDGQRFIVLLVVFYWVS